MKSKLNLHILPDEQAILFEIE